MMKILVLVLFSFQTLAQDLDFELAPSVTRTCAELLKSDLVRPTQDVPLFEIRTMLNLIQQAAKIRGIDKPEYFWRHIYVHSQSGERVPANSDMGLMALDQALTVLQPGLIAFAQEFRGEEQVRNLSDRLLNTLEAVRMQDRPASKIEFWNLKNKMIMIVGHLLATIPTSLLIGGAWSFHSSHTFPGEIISAAVLSAGIVSLPLARGAFGSWMLAIDPKLRLLWENQSNLRAAKFRDAILHLGKFADHSENDRPLWIYSGLSTRITGDLAEALLRKPVTSDGWTERESDIEKGVTESIAALRSKTLVGMRSEEMRILKIDLLYRFDEEAREPVAVLSVTIINPQLRSPTRRVKKMKSEKTRAVDTFGVGVPAL